MDRHTMMAYTALSIASRGKKHNLYERNAKPASSNNCNIIASISGCALSTSSNRTTAFGQALSCFVSWPPSSCPIYPGGEPINFATYHIISHNLHDKVQLHVEWSTKTEPDRLSNVISPGLANSVPGSVVTNSNEVCHVSCSWRWYLASNPILQ